MPVRLQARRLTLARGMDTRPAQIFLRKYRQDTDRCEIMVKSAYEEVHGDEWAQAIDYLEDMTNLIRHIN